ncbi:MAG: hypothetical protein ACRCWM_04105 [Sarcina sp.]
MLGIGTAGIVGLTLVEFLGAMFVGGAIKDWLTEEIDDDKIMGNLNKEEDLEVVNISKEEIMDYIDLRRMKCIDKYEYEEVIKLSVALLTSIKSEINTLRRKDKETIIYTETLFDDKEINLIGEIFGVNGVKIDPEHIFSRRFAGGEGAIKSNSTHRETSKILLSDIKFSKETFELFKKPIPFYKAISAINFLEEDEERFYSKLVSFIFREDISMFYDGWSNIKR